MKHNEKLNDKKLSQSELVDEIFQLLFGGYETTALALSWMIYILQEFPHEIGQLKKEISNHIDTDNLNFNDLRKLTYFDNFIRETLRLFPPVYFIPRGLNSHIDINEFQIRSSSKIIYCTSSSSTSCRPPLLLLLFGNKCYGASLLSHLVNLN